MDSIWDEMMIILKELFMVYSRVDDVRDKLLIWLSYKDIIAALNDKREKITLLKESPHYLPMALYIKGAKEKIELLKINKVEASDVYMAVSNVIAQEKILHVSAQTMPEMGTLNDIIYLENKDQFGLTSAVILVEADTCRCRLLVYDDQEETGILTNYKSRIGAMRSFHRRYIKPGKGKEKIKPEWMSIETEMNNEWFQYISKYREWPESSTPDKKERGEIGNR